LAILLRLKAAGEPMPAGAALLCPSIDPQTAPELLDEMGDAAAAYLGGHPIEDPLVSPLRADLGGLPPLLIQCAAGDPMRPEAESLAEHARKHGVDARLELYPSDAHVFHVFWSFLPEAADALAQTGRFVRDLLRSDHATAVGSS
ncbi:MAG: epsilon-lactone hydrolase, partial [Solirubrobacteraceae bacterium]|nr:epsilon-lactone hydrolase [Solirubrobacteraceae bacterium]